MYNNYDEVQAHFANCMRCNLHTTRKNIVFGWGNKQAPLLYVGVAPGEKEDLAGLPFVDEDGGLLFRDEVNLFEKAGIPVTSCFFTYTVACRPVFDNDGIEEDREPLKEEIEACYELLRHTIYTVDPIVIIASGNALKILTKANKKITRVRGEFFEMSIFGAENTLRYPVLATLSPQYLLQNPDTQDDGVIVQTINDLKQAHKIIKALS